MIYRCPKCKNKFWSPKMKLERHFHKSLFPRRVEYCPHCKIELYRNKVSNVLFMLLLIPMVGVWLLPPTAGMDSSQETYKNMFINFAIILALANIIFTKFEAGKREIED